MNVGDDADVRLPRACRNGLCGSCVCDVIESDGIRRTITACNTKLAVPDDGGDLVVDVYRLKQGDDNVMESSMRRFADDWETQFVPDYKRNIVAATSAPVSEYSQPDVWTTYERIPDADPAQFRRSDDDDANTNNPLADGLPPWERVW